MTKTEFEALLDAARKPADLAKAMAAESAFFRALLEHTVYAHVPREPAPPDRIRFIQFVRPDNGQMALPFFSERKQAEDAAAGNVGIVAMAGRRLLELTQGATLMLNPNTDRVALYPPEVNALLEGRPLGHFTHETLQREEQVGVCLPTVPTDTLVLALRELFAREPAVRAAYLVEMHRGVQLADVSLMLTLVVSKKSEERMVQLTSLELNALSPPPAMAVSMTCIALDAELPEYCKHGVQIYGA
jgi:hypothetical protein